MESRTFWESDRSWRQYESAPVMKLVSSESILRRRRPGPVRLTRVNNQVKYQWGCATIASTYRWGKRKALDAKHE